MFPTNVLFFNFFLWSKAMMLKLDDALTPSKYACRAKKGSHHTSTMTTKSESATLVHPHSNVDFSTILTVICRLLGTSQLDTVTEETKLTR